MPITETARRTRSQINNDRRVASQPNVADSGAGVQDTRRRRAHGSDGVDQPGALTADSTGNAANVGRRNPNAPRPQSTVLNALVAGPDLIKDVIGGDGTLIPKAATLDDRLMGVNALALREAGQPGPFDALTDAKGLIKVATQLGVLHGSIAGQPQNEAQTLAWRQTRAAALHLFEEAALRAEKLGDKAAVKAILKETTAVILAEPSRNVRDFAFESLLAHSEAKALPDVKEARELLYPSAPPYDKWPKKIVGVRYCDNDGSLFKDNVDILRGIGFKKVKENADGSIVFLLKKANAKHEVEITLVPPPGDHGKPPVAEHVGNPDVNFIEVCMHAGYGNFLDAALSAGTKGTGVGQLMMAYQCWSEGNIETMERLAADLQFFATTAMTSDDYDAVMQKHTMLGFLEQKSWPEIMKGAIAELKREFKNDGEHETAHWDTHYTAPNQRNAIVKHYDRDGDGTPDVDDHIFNVVYPKRIDAAGGFDPVVQAIPKYALDGTNLNKAVQQLNRAITYNHMLPKAIDSKLPWKGDLYRPGGFFEPAAGDNRAFNFAKQPNGDVHVQLSTRFAHAHQEDLTRMAAVEIGLWLGKEGDAVVKDMSASERGRLPREFKDGVPKAVQGAMAAAFLERVAEQQGSYFAEESGMLDEAWAEEDLLLNRYGMGGFTVAQLRGVVGDPHDYLPEHFANVSAALKDVPGLAGWADKAPVRVGKPFDVPPNTTIVRDNGVEAEVTKLLGALGIAGKLLTVQPTWLTEGQPQNIVAMVDAGGGKRAVYSVGVASDGAVQALSLLPLNFDKKLIASVGTLFDQLATAGGVERPALQKLFDDRKKTLPTFEALKTALLDMRPLLPPGIGLDVSTAMSSLVDAGLATQGEYNEIARRAANLYPQDIAPQEKILLDALEGAAGNKAKQVRAAYIGKLTEIRGGVDGRAAALLAALDALPANARTADIGPALTAVLSAGFVAVPQRGALAGKVAEKLGKSATDVALAGLSRLVDDNVWDDAQKTLGKDKSSAAFKAALRAGKSATEAAEAALEAMHRAGVTGLGGFESLVQAGVLNGTGADAVDVAARMNADVLRRAAEQALFGKIGDDKRDAWFTAVDAAGGDRVAALGTILTGVTLADLSSYDVLGIAALDPTRKADIAKKLCDVADKKPSAITAELITDHSEPAAKAYEAAIKARKPHAEALYAAAVVAVASAGTSLFGTLRDDPFLNAAERDALAVKLEKLAPAGEVAQGVMQLLYALGKEPGERSAQAFFKKLSTLAADGKPLGDELVRFVGTVRGTATDAMSSLAFLRAFPFGERKALAEAVLAATGSTVPAFVFSTIGMPYGSVDDSVKTAARQAFDAKAGNGDLVAAAAAALAKFCAAAGDGEWSIYPRVFADLGLVDEAALAESDAKLFSARAHLPAQVGDLIAQVSNTADKAAVTETAHTALAAGTALDKVISDALGAAGGAVASAADALYQLAFVMQAVAPSKKAKVQKAALDKLSLDKDAAIGTLLKAYSDPSGDDVAGALRVAAYKKEAAQKGPVAALETLIGTTMLGVGPREEGGGLGFPDALRAIGLASAGDIARLDAADRRRAIFEGAVG